MVKIYPKWEVLGISGARTGPTAADKGKHSKLGEEHRQAGKGIVVPIKDQKTLKSETCIKKQNTSIQELP